MAALHLSVTWLLSGAVGHVAQQLFASGVTGTISSNLARNPALRVLFDRPDLPAFVTETVESISPDKKHVKAVKTTDKCCGHRFAGRLKITRTYPRTEN